MLRGGLLPHPQMQPTGRRWPARFQPGAAFLCLEKRGVEPYPSADKAVVFFEVDDLPRVLAEIGWQPVVQHEPNAKPPWAVLHDPEGHNVLLLQAPAT